MSDKKGETCEIVDCRGLACPMPVIQTKKALEDRPEVLIVLVDNEVAKENVAKFAASNGYGVRVDTQVAGVYKIELSGRQEMSVAKAQLPANNQRPVLLIKQQTLGQGSDELGAILMKSFFVSLREAKTLPRTLLLLNGGVYLAIQDSPVLASLQALAGEGVRILVCGTCLDFFGIKSQLAVGSITNMYTVAEELMGVQPVVVL